MKSFLLWGGWIDCCVALSVCSSGGTHVCWCEHACVHMWAGADQLRPLAGAATSDSVDQPHDPRALGPSCFPLTKLVNFLDNRDVDNLGGLCLRLLYPVFKNLEGNFRRYLLHPGSKVLAAGWDLDNGNFGFLVLVCWKFFRTPRAFRYCLLTAMISELPEYFIIVYLEQWLHFYHTERDTETKQKDVFWNTM